MAIAFASKINNKTTDNGTPTASTNLVGTKTISVGDFVIVTIGGSENTTAQWTGSNVTDTGGNTYTKIASQNSAAGFAKQEVWVCTNATSSATSATAALTGVDVGTAHSIGISVESYTGVAALGTVTTFRGNGNASTITGSITTQDANNFVVGCIVIDSDGADAGFGTGWATAPTSGTNRDLVTMINVLDADIAIIDKSSVAAASTTITCAASGSTTFDWVMTLLELRSTTGVVATGNKKILQEDGVKAILLESGQFLFQ